MIQFSLLKFLTQYILLLSQSLLLTFCNSTTHFTSLFIKRAQIFLHKPFDLSLRYICFKRQWVQKEFCDCFNTQSWHWGIDIVFTKKLGQFFFLQCDFSLATDHKIANVLRTLQSLQAKCLIHKCLIEIWTWMAQFSCGQFWISPVIDALNNLKADALSP